MIWERLIKWQDETIDLLNKELVEYNEPGMEKFNNDTWAVSYTHLTLTTKA